MYEGAKYVLMMGFEKYRFEFYTFFGQCREYENGKNIIKPIWWSRTSLISISCPFLVSERKRDMYIGFTMMFFVLFCKLFQIEFTSIL